MFDPQIDQKSIKNQSTNHPNNTTSKISKMLKNHLFLYTFCYFGHVLLYKKSIKIVPRSLQKQLSNQHPNLDRFWTQLGPILGGFWGSKWGQVGTKSLQKSIFKSIKKMITFWIALGSNFNGFWPPFGEPNRSLRSTLALIFWVLGLNIAPRPPKTPPKIDFS